MHRTMLMLALILGGCSVSTAQFGTRQSKECGFYGRCSYEAERIIGGRTHLFRGEEQTPRARAFTWGSVVRWTDAATGSAYVTKVPCAGGIIPSLFSEDSQLFSDSCLDEVDVGDHADQLPGDR